MNEITINLNDIKEQIIERAAEKLAQLLLNEIKNNGGTINPLYPFETPPRYPMDMQPVMYGCIPQYGPQYGNVTSFTSSTDTNNIDTNNKK